MAIGPVMKPLWVLTQKPVRNHKSCGEDGIRVFAVHLTAAVIVRGSRHRGHAAPVYRRFVAMTL